LITQNSRRIEVAEDGELQYCLLVKWRDKRRYFEKRSHGTPSKQQLISLSVWVCQIPLRPLA
jgi:hypothetical protein